MLTEMMIIEDELHSGRDICEDIHSEENDDEEGTKVSTAAHDDFLLRLMMIFTQD